MNRLIWILAFAAALAVQAARAQDAWVQIEAQPSLTEAEERARAYAGAFANVNGFRLSSGWYGILLGPYTPDEAARQLELLRGERLIPADSFIPERATLGMRFWPAGIDLTAPADQPTLTPLPEETVAEATASEQELPGEARMDLQRAMQYFGVYAGAIDGSFGKGTRAAMADWQAASGYEPTGVLTTAQRAALLDDWQADRESLGLTRVDEAEAGISIDLPLGLVTFARYAPPYVIFDEAGNSGYQVMLISRQGDARALMALYDAVQSLAAIPMEGPRELGRESFTIIGEGQGRTAHAEAHLAGGFIKGFALIGPTDDTVRFQRVRDAMQASFTATGDHALDDSLGEPSATSAADLSAGLDVRAPSVSRSGTFVDAAGAVLTTTEVLDNCTRITLDGRLPATVVAQDDLLGIAVLRPDSPLAPRAVASLAPGLPRLDADVAMAGYSYGERLSAPVVTRGTFSEPTGLNGEPELARLTLQTLPGDVGGAVLDGSGAMIGMLAPRTDEGGRELPKDVSFILQSAAIAGALTPKGIVLQPAEPNGSLAAETLARRARDMTVLVSCWK